MRTVILLSFLGAFYCQAQNYGWDSNVYLPGLGRDDAVCFTLDEIVFIGTGNHGGFSESNVFYALNTRNNQWQNVAPFPGTARQYARIEEVGFKAYLIGGIDWNNTPLNDVWEYDYQSDSWSQMNDFPGMARWKACSFVVGGKIYYGTGRDWNQSFNDFWKYDPEKDEWKQAETAPFIPRDETIGFSLYERGFVGLGMDCTGVMQSDIWKYDPYSDTWVYETDFPAGPRWYAVSEVLNGKAFIGTGEDESGNLYNDFWMYDPATQSWEQAENLPSPARRGVSACSIPFKGIFFACGLSSSFQRLTDVSRYTNRNQILPINLNYNEEEKKVYINDLPGYGTLKIVNLQGKLLFESRARVDHVIVDVTNWSRGVYIVWARDQSKKLLIY
ncbi:MAG: hypothetical protein HUJ25_02555 [Crocinitomicaceae bacterium]|nr:hypothetical protein [Crocinitomicaceae bacterium]